MSTMIDNDLGTDILSMLDFEHAPPCEVPRGCDGTAEWKVTVGCCGQLYLMCQECVDHLLDWYRSVGRLGIKTNIKCVACKNTVSAHTFILSIERI